MTIPKDVLDRWTNQGAITVPQKTHKQIRRALDKHDWGDIVLKTYLQGSYRNETNIYGNSDVDLVVELRSSFYRDISQLSDTQKEKYLNAFSLVKYTWSDMHRDVLAVLQQRFGTEAVETGKKCIKVMAQAGSGRLDADVVICVQYRKYLYFESIDRQDYVEGMTFWVASENRWVVNYPKYHVSHGSDKNNYKNTKHRYKPTVRLFKNAKQYLIRRKMIDDETVSSYFIECLLYNVPNEFFCNPDLQDRYKGIVAWLLQENGSMENFRCQNGQVDLFGNNQDQWSVDHAEVFIKALADLWEQW